MNTKPNIFIGSSREAIKLAAAIHSQLSYHTQVTPWYAGAFEANDYTMEALERELDRSDFGIFVFAPDDVSLHRGRYVFITRDNTLFEMGLFWGKLRRRRVFALIPDGVRERNDLVSGEVVKEFHLLSDLQGLTLLRYELRADGNHKAAVSVACQEMIESIAELGSFHDPKAVIERKNIVIQQKESVLHFFWEYNRHTAFANTREKYEALSEAVRNSIIPPADFRVTGAAIWQKQGSDGIGQVGGNVGRGRFYPFTVNEQTAASRKLIFVVDVFLSGKWAFFSRRELAHVYVLCYPLGSEHVLSVHFSGHRDLNGAQVNEVVDLNQEVLNTIDYMVGGDSNEEPENG